MSEETNFNPADALAAPDHGVRDHAPLGGSSASRWTNCPGSVFFYQKMPEQESSEAADLGTHVHELIDIAVNDMLRHYETGSDLEETVGPLLEKEDEIVQTNVRNYRDILVEKVLEGAVTGKYCGTEEKFILDESLGMYGYIDFWAIYIDDRAKRVGVIADYKNGYHSVSVEKNAQLAFYACAMREEIKKSGKDLDYVRAVIYQPNVPGEEAYRETKFTAKQLDKWKETFHKAAEQIFVKQKPKFKAGEWCRFCRAKGVCPTFAKEHERKLGLKLIDVSRVELPTPEQLSEETIIKVIKHGDLLEDFVSACRAYAIEKAKLGHKFEGLKLVEGKSRRKWIDNEDKVIEILAEAGLNPVTPKLKGIGDVEKELVKLKICKKQECSEYLSGLTEKTKPGLKLVNENADGVPAASMLTKIEEIENE